MTPQVPLRAIVPMKPAYGGKSRLSGVLDPDSRAALCLLLLQHMLRAVAGASNSLEAWVVGGDEWVRRVAEQESAGWQEDPGEGLNGAIRHAADNAFKNGASAILVLPGDLGLLEAGDVDHMVMLSHGLGRTVIAKAVSDGGTNAILAPRGMLIGPCFGPDSFTRHMEAARSGNVPVEVATTHGLGFDLDTPRDLAAYREQRPGLDQALQSWREMLRSGASVRAK